MVRLSPLTAFFEQHPYFQELSAPSGETQKISGLSSAAQALLAATLSQKNIPWMVVAKNLQSAKRWQADLECYGIEVALFAPLEVPPYAGISPEEELRTERQSVLATILDEFKPVVTTAKALMQLLPPPESWQEACLRIKPGDRLPPAELIQQLVRLGFIPAAAVTVKGEFSRRGGVLDVYPSSLEAPIRIDWFDDEIESIRTFDSATQRSLDKLESVSIWPSREIVYPEQGWETVQAAITKTKNAQGRRLFANKKYDASKALEPLAKVILEKLGSFQYFEGCEYYLPFFQSKLATFFDYLPKDTRILWEDQREILGQLGSIHEEWQTLYKQRVEAGEALELPRMLHLDPKALEVASKPFTHISFASDGLDWDAPPAPAFGNRFERLAESCLEWSKAGEKVVIASTQPHRVYAILEEHYCHSSYGNTLPQPDWKVGGVWIVRDSLSIGFRCPEIGLSLLTDAELFGWSKRPSRLAKKPKFAGNAFNSVTELKEGDHVVHLKHGIGVYHGLRKLVMDGEEREYLLVTYQGDDKLYVPIDQISLLHRYRGGEGHPRVHKMGGSEWEAVKRKVKKSVQLVAEDLLKLYAERASQPGHAFSPDTIWQNEMEEAFPYQETVDQLRAIVETKQDMERPRPMDRLICGDVGFGKTEVALRAAFKGVTGGKQVAVLAPTTLLAQQHYQVFRERFAPYPIRCALLSRFKTPKEIKDALRGLATGEIDFVVGTHRLLQKDVTFKDLGLLIIDEEHRFGVAHKERLKQLRASVDVLTMSATPIPRTLYLALSGARDMSLITTPPLNRQPIKTLVGPYDPETIKTAILHELERDGQVFFLHNRVESIGRVAEEIGQLVPQARIAVAHGQMQEGMLEDIMLGFLNHETDILVTTTIIESGLDIPNANTIIVDQAERLGLAQLYQIRGRVGRSDRKAYCFCLHAPGKRLTDDARDRLAAISQYTALGSGYQIALRDLEIRGVGNILGEEQHGHMLAVGYDVYMQLLEEAVHEVQGQGEKPQVTTLVDLNVAAYLPDEWLDDPALKMGQYKRLAGAMALKEIDFIQEEWQDRYGKLPLVVLNLLRLVKMKLRATELGITTIRHDARQVYVELDIPRKEWADIQVRTPGVARWQFGQTGLVCNREMLSAEQQLDAVERLLSALEKRIPEEAFSL